MTIYRERKIAKGQIIDNILDTDVIGKICIPVQNTDDRSITALGIIYIYIYIIYHK